MVRLISLTLVVAGAIGMSATGAQKNGEPASNVQSMTGVVKAVSASALAIETGGNAVMFAVDSATRVLAKTGPRDLVLRKRRPGLSDFVKTGDQVTVRYRASGDVLKAVEVRIIPK